MTGDLSRLTPEELERWDYLVALELDRLVHALAPFEPEFNRFLKGTHDEREAKFNSLDMPALEEEMRLLNIRAGILVDADAVFRPQPSQERGPGVKRQYVLTRAQQYADAVYAAIRERGMHAPPHPVIRRQVDAAALLYRCNFHTDQIAQILGITRRHVLVLKNQLKREKATSKKAAKNS